MKRSFVILAVLTTVFLALPFIGLFQRVSWSELDHLLTSDTTPVSYTHLTLPTILLV